MKGLESESKEMHKIWNSYFGKMLEISWFLFNQPKFKIYQMLKSWNQLITQTIDGLMIAKNSSSSIYPSQSLSNSSIIAISSSSLKLSPSSLATFFKSFKEIFPLFYVSKSLNAFKASSMGSLSEYFFPII